LNALRKHFALYQRVTNLHDTNDRRGAASLKPAVRLTARAPERLFRLVFESHDGRALVQKHERASDIDTVLVTSLKVLDLELPIREADIAPTSSRLRSNNPNRQW
jgi:hypothetical protein